MTVDNIMYNKTYPRINAHKQRADIRINALKRTHKHSHISYMPLYKSCSSAASPVDNASVTAQFPPIYCITSSGNQTDHSSGFLKMDDKEQGART